MSGLQELIMKTRCVGGPLNGQLVDNSSNSFHAHDEADNCRIVLYRKHRFMTQGGDVSEYFDMFVYGPLEEQGEVAMLEQANAVLAQCLNDVLKQTFGERTT
jgi:hypothetical protein